MSIYGHYKFSYILGYIYRRITRKSTEELKKKSILLQCGLCVWSILSMMIVLRKRVGIRPLLVDKFSSTLIPQDGAIAPEGFVFLPIMDDLINKIINYQ
jgi:hypothetical protein